MASTDAAQIDIAFPDASDLHLKIGVGACRLKVAPGDGVAWVSGTYDHPSSALPPRIEQEGGTVTITQERTLAGIGGLLRRAPSFDLALGKARPYMLTLEVGASESSFDLGGLPIKRLIVKQGAGKVDFDFSSPNPQAMSLLDLDAGAVGMEMKNLANANFAEMTINGGAASYKFDFGSRLQRDAHVKITAGLCSVEIDVPSTTAARIISESVLGGVDVGDGFTRKEGAFCTEAAVTGKAPVLTIDTSISLGSLLLRTT